MENSPPDPPPDSAVTPPTCPRCSAALPVQGIADGSLDACPHCRVPLRVAVLPAASRPAPAPAMPTPALPGEAVCFHHESRRAVVPCDHCGRFLCALCDLPIGNQHLCSSCLDSGLQRGPGGTLESRRLRPDRIAGSLLLIGVLSCGVLLPLSGLGAVIVAWRYRNAPPSRVDASAAALRWMGAAGMLGVVLGTAVWWGLVTQVGPLLYSHLASLWPA